MIYLTQLILNPCTRRVQAELRNPYEMHRTLSRAFGDGEAAYQQARCLFRVEPADRQVVVLVQSLLAPCWDTHLQCDAYLLHPPRIKQLEWHANHGHCLRFRLRANPTKRLPASREADKLAGKRVQLYQEEEQLGWLSRKGAAHGFTVLDARISAAERQLSRQSGRSLIHHAVLFDGRLQVTDVQQFGQALTGGIGAGKGFGFGLLSGAPV